MGVLAVVITFLALQETCSIGFCHRRKAGMDDKKSLACWWGCCWWCSSVSPPPPCVVKFLGFELLFQSASSFLYSTTHGACSASFQPFPVSCTLFTYPKTECTLFFNTCAIIFIINNNNTATPLLLSSLPTISVQTLKKKPKQTLKKTKQTLKLQVTRWWWYYLQVDYTTTSNSEIFLLFFSPGCNNIQNRICNQCLYSGPNISSPPKRILGWQQLLLLLLLLLIVQWLCPLWQCSMKFPKMNFGHDSIVNKNYYNKVLMVQWLCPL